MTRVRRMRTLQRVIDRKQQAAARDLDRVRRELHHHRARLDELAGYRNDYETDYLISMRAGFNAVCVQDYRVFLGRLDEAIRRQRELVDGLLREVQRSTEIWEREHRHSEAVNRLFTRLRDLDLVVRETREQRDADERAARSDAGRNRR